MSAHSIKTLIFYHLTIIITISSLPRLVSKHLSYYSVCYCCRCWSEEKINLWQLFMACSWVEVACLSKYCKHFFGNVLFFSAFYNVTVEDCFHQWEEYLNCLTYSWFLWCLYCFYSMDFAYLFRIFIFSPTYDKSWVLQSRYLIAHLYRAECNIIWHLKQVGSCTQISQHSPK